MNLEKIYVTGGIVFYWICIFMAIWTMASCNIILMKDNGLL